MIIQSQNGMYLIPFPKENRFIQLIDESICVLETINECQGKYGLELGMYDTPKRAQEILDEMLSHYDLLNRPTYRVGLSIEQVDNVKVEKPSMVFKMPKK